VVIRRLDSSDKRSEFTSGQPDLDRFFREKARQDQDRNLSVTYVAVEGTEVLGYATIMPMEIEVGSLPATRARLAKKTPKYPVPALRLARMAVSKDKQGQGLGKKLLTHVFVLAKRQARDLGCLGVVVDAKPDAIRFYAPFGFEAMQLEEPAAPGSPTPMFIEMGAIPDPPDEPGGSAVPAK
jgi:predicted N-acetyltransferase YhbS